ncbi:MAG: hypothetical protein ACXVYV_09750 [Gaiellales bacterium]
MAEDRSRRMQARLATPMIVAALLVVPAIVLHAGDCDRLEQTIATLEAEAE